MDEKLKVFEDKMQKSYNNLLEEYTTIRAGRANPHVLDKVVVDYYGAPTPLQQVANISVPEARMIQIQPWESSLLKDIEKAILVADLGLNPTNDGKVIRLVFPELTEERRKQLANPVSAYFKIPKAVLAEKMTESGIPATARAEQLTMAELVKLYEIIDELKKE